MGVITRQQLATFVKDPRTLKALEETISTVISGNNSAALSLDDAINSAFTANAKSQEAIDAINRLASAVQLLSLSPAAHCDMVVPVDYSEHSLKSWNPAYKEGRLFYDYNDHSLAYYNDAQDVTLNIGREQLVRVYNATGVSIANGQMVYVNGASSGFPTVTVAVASSSTAASAIIGMTTSSIGIASFGYVTVSGVVNGVDTSAYAAGTLLYLSDVTAGAVTSTAPVQPNYVVEVGTVLSQSATAGKVMIRLVRREWFPNLVAVLNTASVALPTTPTVIKPNITTRAEGVGYDSSTGIFTINQSQNYTLAFQINATPSAANKNIYLYSEENTGSGWAPNLYSGRQLNLPNAQETQVVAVASRYFEVGTQIRFYVWGDATVTLITSNLPGTTAGTVQKPAFRLTIA
jgi:hypothetical protein